MSEEQKMDARTEVLYWARAATVQEFQERWPSLDHSSRLLAMHSVALEVLSASAEMLLAEEVSVLEHLPQRKGLPPEMVDGLIKRAAALVPDLEGEDEVGSLGDVRRLMTALNRGESRTSTPEAWAPLFKRFRGERGEIALNRVMWPALTLGFPTLGSAELRVLARAFCKWGKDREDRYTLALLAEHPGADETVWEEMLRAGTEIQMIYACFPVARITRPYLRQRLEKMGEPWILLELASGSDAADFMRLTEQLMKVRPLLAVEALEGATPEQLAGLSPTFLTPLLESSDAEVRLRSIAFAPRLGRYNGGEEQSTPSRAGR